jgi:hypothetical protein
VGARAVQDSKLIRQSSLCTPLFSQDWRCGVVAQVGIIQFQVIFFTSGGQHENAGDNNNLQMNYINVYSYDNVVIYFRLLEFLFFFFFGQFQHHSIMTNSSKFSRPMMQISGWSLIEIHTFI